MLSRSIGFNLAGTLKIDGFSTDQFTYMKNSEFDHITYFHKMFQNPSIVVVVVVQVKLNEIDMLSN